MYGFYFLILLLVVAWHEVNARAVEGLRLAINDALPYLAIEKNPILPRQLHLTRDSSGCLIPVSTSPAKRNAQTDICYDCPATLGGNDNSIATVFDSSDPANENTISGAENPDLEGGEPTLFDEGTAFDSEKDASVVVDGAGKLAETPPLDTSGTNSLAVSDARLEFAIKRPEMCHSPFGNNVYTVHFMEQFSDEAPASQQHQSIIVSEFGTENDIRYHITGVTKGARMKFKKEPWFNFVGRVLNKWELRGFIVPAPHMSKLEALALFEAVMATIDIPIVSDVACNNCQTWVAEVLAEEELHCKVYAPVPAGPQPN